MSDPELVSLAHIALLGLVLSYLVLTNYHYIQPAQPCRGFPERMYKACQ